MKNSILSTLSTKYYLGGKKETWCSYMDTIFVTFQSSVSHNVKWSFTFFVYLCGVQSFPKPYLLWVREM